MPVAAVSVPGPPREGVLSSFEQLVEGHILFAEEDPWRLLKEKTPYKLEGHRTQSLGSTHDLCHDKRFRWFPNSMAGVLSLSSKTAV